jgi:hypothetical protein
MRIEPSVAMDEPTGYGEGALWDFSHAGFGRTTAVSPGATKASEQRLAVYSLPIYNWFTEGFDAPDLKDAKALLHELA